MNISVFGLGYVGCVTIGCLASKGNSIIGVDISDKKMKLIESGKSTVVENGLDDLIYEGVKKGLITTSDNVEYAVNNSDIAIICVGTPNNDKGFLDMKYIRKVTEDIAKVLKKKNKYFTLSIRSTVNPGTNDEMNAIIENISNKSRDVDFGVVSNPEFLREGSAVSDFFNPPYTVLSSSSEKSLSIIKKLYDFLESPVKVVDIKVAELIKFLNNSFHALKVSFGNEVGRLSKSLNLGSNDLIDLFLEDDILNISKAYYRPGFSYGGSCLPKDLLALNALASNLNLQLPLLSNVEKSNTIHTNFIIDRILEFNIHNIGIYGLAFKKGTDDLRFSKSITVCEQLLGKGKDVFVLDNFVNISKLVGQNMSYLNNKIPHINKMLIDDYDEFISKCNLIVLVHKTSDKFKEKIKLFLTNDKNFILDLSIDNDLKKYSNYYGCNW